MNDFSIKQFFNEYPYVPYVIAISIAILLILIMIAIIYQRKYTIVFNCGDEILEKKKARKGSLLDLPVLEKEGGTFVGWFFDKELTKQAYIYTFPKQNVTLYAKFEETESAVVEDVKETSLEEETISENLIEESAVGKTSEVLETDVSEDVIQLDVLETETLEDSTENVDTSLDLKEENEVLQSEDIAIEPEIVPIPIVESDLDSSTEVVFEDSQTVKQLDNFITTLRNSSLKNHTKFTDIANSILKYRKVTYRFTRKECIFKYKGEVISRVGFSGDNLKVYLPLNVSDYSEFNVKLKDVSTVKKYEATPLLINLKTDKATKFFMTKLVLDLKDKFELLEKRGYKEQSYNRLVLALKDSPLIKSGKEELLKERINILDVDVLADEEAKSMFIYKSGVLAKNVKNVPISALEENFLPGTLIDLRQLKLKNLVSDDTQGIKIVGKGTLTKSFTVVCDDISLAAAKMILLTGGKVVLLIEEV